MITRRKVLSVVGAFATVVAFGACSSSSKSSSGSPTTSSQSSSGSSAAQASGAPIKVGEICSCSGEPGFSQFSVPSQQAIKAWANSVNASGGINGHPVQLIADDDGTNPGTSVSDAQTLISDHVVAIIDDTTLVQAWAPAVEAANIPVVGSYTINAPFDSSPDFYAEGQTNQTTLQAIVAVAKEAGAKNIGNMYCAEAPICAQSVPFMRAAGKAAGVPDVYDASISATAPNFAAQCLAAKQAGVTALFIGDASAVDDHVAADCSQQGFDPVYVTEAAGFGLNQASAAGISKNLWSQYPDFPFWVNTPAVQAFNSTMDKYFPGVRENNNVFTEDAFMSWIAAKLLEDGLKAGVTSGSTPSASQLTSGLDSLKGDTVGGLAPPLTFTAGQPHHVNCYFVAHIQNGTPVLANNGKATCVNGSSS